MNGIRLEASIAYNSFSALGYKSNLGWTHKTKYNKIMLIFELRTILSGAIYSSEQLNQCAQDSPIDFEKHLFLKSYKLP